jgi:hypothetical protein
MTEEVPQSQPDQRLGGHPHTAVSTGRSGEPQRELPWVVPSWGPDVVEQLGRQQKGTWSHPRPRTNVGHHVPKNSSTHLGNSGAAQLMPAHGETRGEEGHVWHHCTPQEKHRLHVGPPRKDEMMQESHESPRQSGVRESLEGAPHRVGEQPLDITSTKQRSPHAKGGRLDCIVSRTWRNRRSTPHKGAVQPKERREERSQCQISQGQAKVKDGNHRRTRRGKHRLLAEDQAVEPGAKRLLLVTPMGYLCSNQRGRREGYQKQCPWCPWGAGGSSGAGAAIAADMANSWSLAKPSMKTRGGGGVAERAERDVEWVRQLKGGNIWAGVDDHLMALHQEELVHHPNRTMAVVQRGIIKEPFPVRRTGEGGDLEYQWNDRGGSNVALIPHWSTDRQRRLHQRNCKILQSARSNAKG